MAILFELRTALPASRALLLPGALWGWRTRGDLWSSLALAPAAGAAVLMLLYASDCLSNAMPNPVFMLLSGGLAGLTRPDPVHDVRDAMSCGARSARVGKCRAHARSSW